MKTMKINPRIIGQVVDVLLQTGNRRATKYISENTVVTATQRNKPSKKASRVDLVLKLGRPNYAERAFIKSCKKAGESFPVKKIQLRAFPSK